VLQSMRSAAKYIFWFIAITFIGGFLLAETSGLLGRSAVTTSTPVATVNGREIPYLVWSNLTQSLAQQQEQQLGRGLTLDERQQIEQQAFDQLVTDVLVEQELKRRGIAVSKDEIIEQARYNPPPQLMNNPDLLTEGRFDPEKYQRFLSSSAARQQGVLAQLEAYYRSEIPRQKLFEQVSSDVYLTDHRLWQIYQDRSDSAQVSFVVLRPESLTDSAVRVTEAEIRSYYDAHKKELERPGRAVVSLLTIPRVVTAADSATVRAHAEALRSEILGGAKFEEVAKRESADSVSASEGGSLGRGGRGRFVPAFENAAYALKPGEVSQPVLTPFGYHLIRVDEHKGDTLALRHILLKIQQSDSSATRTDRRADSLAALAASADEPAKFDAAAKKLGLAPVRATVVEREPLTVNGRYVPSVSAWAFGGAKPGETSDLLDDENGYYLARLDSLTPGGLPSFEQARQDIRRQIAREKKLQQLLPIARSVAAAATQSSLEAAAQANKLEVEKTPLFTRVSAVPGLGQFNEAIGAAFALPVGAVSAPVKTEQGIYVLRIDRRVNADRAAFEKAKPQMRLMMTQGLRQQRVREYLLGMRRAAKIEDHRKDIMAATRRQSS
jgi:peptidyl-prolyl cis-trans isomerase D